MPKDDQLFIGIDLGGTNIQAGLMRGGKLMASERIKTKAEEGDQAVLERIVKVVDKTCAAAGAERASLCGVGIGAPGVIDITSGVVIEAVNLRWNDYPLAEKLSKALNVPVTVDNDVNVGTWAECQVGAARKMTDVLGVFVGTGIGGGLIIGGKLYHGYHMTAGEIGHTIIDPDAGLGRRTLENLASRTSIVNLLTAMVKANHPNKLMELTGGDLTKIRSKTLSKAFETKGPLTIEVLQRAAHYVGVSIANTVTLLSLQGAVVGGGLTEAIGQPFVDMVKRSFREAVFPAKLRNCPILLTELGDNAGVIGAALLAQERLNRE